MQEVFARDKIFIQECIKYILFAIQIGTQNSRWKFQFHIIPVKSCKQLFNGVINLVSN